MVYEFEGRTESEAVEKAVSDLGLEKDQFDVEILEIQKSSLFKKGFVKIRVHVLSNSVEGKKDDIIRLRVEQKNTDEDKNECRKILQDFILTLIERLGYSATIENISMERKNLVLHLSSMDSPVLIGKHGKNLDALQLLANTFLSNKGFSNFKVLLDCENYRVRREESLVRLAYETADKVTLSKKSILLEPMNPYERRLIHTTLNDIHDIETKSEGEGAYRRVRVSLR